MKTSPFKFLDSFTKDDKDIFFGRDKEIVELYFKVFESKILLVYGVSGTGKTSLINCGLANKFEDSDWLPVFVRRGKDISESLLASLEKQAITPFGKDEKKSLQKAILSVYLDHFKPVYFIFDQIEEVFIFGSREERKAFISQIKDINNSDLQCRFIFVIREEYLAGITEFEEFIPGIMKNRLRVEKMVRNDAVQAIEGPCKSYGISFEEGFSELLLEKLNPQSTEVELTFLQIYLDKLYRLSGKYKTTFTKDLIDRAGNVKDLLGEFLEEQVAKLQNPEEGLSILKAFVSIKGTKRQVTEEDIEDTLKTIGRQTVIEKIRSYVQEYVSLRILREKDDNGCYELRHDALASKIFEKITFVERELLEIKQFIENAFENFQRRSVLLSASDLSYIAPYEDKLYLSFQLTQFLDQSKKYIHRAKRRRRNIVIIGVACLFLIFAGFTIWALNEKNKADKAIVKQLESILKLNENFNSTIKAQNLKKKDLYKLIRNGYMMSPESYEYLWNKALHIQKSSNDLIGFIYQLEYMMIATAENISIDSAGKTDLAFVEKNTNSAIPELVLFKSDIKKPIPNISLLKRKIQSFKKTLYLQIDKKDWEKIPFNLDPDKAVIEKKARKVTWEYANFHKATLAGAVTNLNSIIIELNNSEVDAITYLSSGITYGDWSFDCLFPTVVATRTAIAVGDNYEAEVLLSAYDSKKNMEVFIGGKDSISVEDYEHTDNMLSFISKNGIAKIVIPTKEPNSYKIPGFMLIKSMDGRKLHYPFYLEFDVFHAPASISTTRSNVLYRGIDNPVDISVPGYKPDDVIVTASNGKLTYSGKGEYIFNPGKEHKSIFIISTNINHKLKEYQKKTFRIINTPDPVPAIGYKRGGDITKAEILASAGVNLKSEKSDFNIKYNVVGFSLMIIESSDKIKIESAKGPLFSENQKKLISNLKTGQYLFVKDISVKGSDGSSRVLNGMIFKIVK
jgi:gliding motility-associated protein GldM